MGGMHPPTDGLIGTGSCLDRNVAGRLCVVEDGTRSEQARVVPGPCPAESLLRLLRVRPGEESDVRRLYSRGI